MLDAVKRYFDTPAPSELASSIRMAHRAPAKTLSRTVSDYAPPGSTKQARLTRGYQITHTAGRVRRDVLLVGQVGKGFPGREPELVLIASLASAWVAGGLRVTVGGPANGAYRQSLFEKLIDDVFVAMLIDDKVSARNLVRTHIARRDRA